MLTRRSFTALAAAVGPVAAVSTRTRPSEGDWEALRRGLDGEVVLPTSPGYDQARALASRQFDRIEPRAVVMCESTGDVSEAVRFARRHGVHLATRSGGHSFGGYSTTSGMVVNLSRMRGLTATGDTIRVQPGAQLVDILDQTVDHGVAAPSGTCATVGIGGLALGGGIGVEARQHGLTVDRMRSAEVVLADGRVVGCEQDRHPDLYWALRGAGAGNFGVVTSLVIEPVPAPAMTNYTLTWPWSATPAVLDAWQRWAPAAPDPMSASAQVLLEDAGAGGEPRTTVYGTWLDTPGALSSLLERFVDLVGIDPATNTTRTWSYREAMMRWYQCDHLSVPECHIVGDGSAGRLPRVIYAASRGTFVRDPIPPAGIRAVLAAFDTSRRRGESRAIELQAFGGAINRVPSMATAFVHRDNLYYLASWVSADAEPNSTRRREMINWLDAWWRTSRRWGTGHAYQNYVDPRLADWRHAYYGANYPRLARIKASYDPENMFHYPQSIR